VQLEGKNGFSTIVAWILSAFMKLLACCNAFFAFIFWILATVNLIRVHFCIKPGQSPHFGSRGIVIFMPSRLTEEGLKARRYVFLGILGFVFCVATAVLMNLINGGSNFD
jgi:hypothetical protein